VAYIRHPWRERPLEAEQERLLAALPEAWNRELSPLMKAIRDEVNRLGGDRITTDGDASIQRTDRTIFADTADAAQTLTMPPAADVDDQHFFFKKVDSTANYVSIVFDGTEECDGAGTVVLTLQYTTVEIVSNGVGYDIASSYP